MSRDEQLKFPAPTPGDLLWPPAMPEPGPAKWTRWRGARRQCATCIQVLQYDDRERKASRPPPYGRRPPAPDPATMRRLLAGEDTMHCYRHGQVLKEIDEKVVKTDAQRREHAAHMARRWRQ